MQQDREQDAAARLVWRQPKTIRAATRITRYIRRTRSVGTGKQEEGQVTHGDDAGDRSTGPEEPEPSLQGGETPTRSSRTPLSSPASRPRSALTFLRYEEMLASCRLPSPLGARSRHRSRRGTRWIPSICSRRLTSTWSASTQLPASRYGRSSGRSRDSGSFGHRLVERDECR